MPAGLGQQAPSLKFMAMQALKELQALPGREVVLQCAAAHGEFCQGPKYIYISVENPMGMETQQNVLFSRLSTLHSPPPGAASSAFSRDPLQQLSITPSWFSVGIFVD